MDEPPHTYTLRVAFDTRVPIGLFSSSLLLAPLVDLVAIAKLQRTPIHVPPGTVLNAGGESVAQLAGVLSCVTCPK